jgi:hypothetical protein
MSRPYLHSAINIYSMQPSQPPKKRLDQVREAIHLKHYSYRISYTLDGLQLNFIKPKALVL